MQTLPEKIDEIESVVLELENNQNQKGMEELWRFVHSLKGTAGTFGYQNITAICHNLEDYLERHSSESFSSYSQPILDVLDLMESTTQSNNLNSGPIIEEELFKILGYKEFDEKPLRFLINEKNNALNSIIQNEISLNKKVLLY